MGILKAGKIPILLVYVIALVIFTALFFSRQNYEFLLYLDLVADLIGALVTMLYIRLLESATHGSGHYPLTSQV